MITLPIDIYDDDLLDWSSFLRSDECDKVEVELLRKVCSCYLWNYNHDFCISNIPINEEEKSLIQERDYIHTENIEIRARFIDVALSCGLYREQRKELMEECSGLYLELYNQVEHYSYFMRSVKVRQVKHLWTDEYKEKILNSLRNSNLNPIFLKEISQRLITNLGLESSCIKEILVLYENRSTKEDYAWKTNYIKMLLAFDILSKCEYHQKQALNYELEADDISEHKEPNTLYPNLHQIYQDAFDEIDKVKDVFSVDWQRIHDKCVKSKREFADTLSVYGIKTKYKLSNEFKLAVESDVQRAEIKTLNDIISILIHVPYYPAIPELVKDIQERRSKESPLLAGSFNMVNLDDEGNIVGKSDKDGGSHVTTHNILRSSLLFYLLTIYNHLRSRHINVDENDIYTLICSLKSKYVDDQRAIFWTKGISACLNGEDIIGTHLLIPQIEHFLHDIAENIVGDQTKLSNDIQLENTLGGILKALRPHMQDELFYEISYFLNDGVAVNLRNEVMHGLAKPLKVQGNSMYVLYIALKLLIQEERFLNIK